LRPPQRNSQEFRPETRAELGERDSQSGSYPAKTAKLFNLATFRHMDVTFSRELLDFASTENAGATR
jgi:hypothetical protein